MYLEYVHSHQARLKARLGESEEAENEFKEESNQIKSDIYHLVATEKSGNESASATKTATAAATEASTATKEAKDFLNFDLFNPKKRK